jgi:pyruvate kinase
MTRKTKIVATIGPASEPILSDIINAGANVLRMNMSHGDHAEHGARIDAAQAMRAAGLANIEILMDLSGPKIRTTDFPDGAGFLTAGENITVQYGTEISSNNHLYINYEKIVAELNIGNKIMIDDGKCELEVMSKTDNTLECTIVYGGKIKSRRGVNLPGAYLSVSAITEKDKRDFAYGVEKNVDYFALSFVRTAKDIEELRQMLADAGSNAKIVAKLETSECMDHLDSIIAATDLVMIARGDLAVEIGYPATPIAQMEMFRIGRELGKPVIMATQLLESMAENPVPLRAEVSDVAHAVWDGAWGCMMSGESAAGNYPLHTVKMMASVIDSAETYQTKMGL